MLEASAEGRSSYAAGLDTLYFEGGVEADVVIPLTLNGNSFKGIQGLKEGTDYTYNEKAAAVTLKADYINKLFEEKSGYGAFAQLIFQFSSGADWRETFVKCALPVFGNAVGTVKGHFRFRFNSTAQKSAASRPTPGRKRQAPIPAGGSIWNTPMPTWWGTTP